MNNSSSKVYMWQALAEFLRYCKVTKKNVPRCNL